jgi:hypothetical protein
MLVHSPGGGRSLIVCAFGGIFLVALGVALAADQLGYEIPYRWMFLLLILPALGQILDGMRIAGLVGWQNLQPIARITTGFVFGLIGILMSLRLNTGLVLPVLVIALGVATTIRAALGKLP